MFGALNRIIGRLDEAPREPRNPTGESTSFGFQVLRNKDPELPLEPWFDFIVGINGHAIEDPNPNLFATEVRNCAGSSVTFEIWSAKGQRTHTVSIPVSPRNPSLGVALQLAPLSSTQHIWHVLSIPSPLSPAYRAGLLPHSDYIIGTPSGTLRGESALGELVEDHLDRTLVLWVYNNEFDVIREVELVPTRGWGGEGALGAELGYGALHRLPVGLGEEVEGPGEVVFETREDGTSTPVAADPFNPKLGGVSGGGQFLVPANMPAPPPFTSPNGTLPPPSGTKAAGRRKPRHAALSPSRGFDEYFAEGEQKSREQDYAPSRGGTPLPPPPKIGPSPSDSTSPAPGTEAPVG
ncbi:putative Golgi reassembly stacking protein [Aspergillus chevalieri]|uniref:PDZ GRASP-type domain-containing protein n=1 Tax=Aspergillus chevalieri TaxID=182096 RepID=A0A7R7VYQ6_ASPCH|nr:uncharacterized protein ACHE_80653S [Aspergillus chevalieri]BCR92753.1 hypothetical protein ACHE_80653S [Aspergillus chevalieri]